MFGKTVVSIVITAIVFSSILAGCSTEKNKPSPQEQAEQTKGLMMTSGNAVAGLVWALPANWQEGPPQQMRSATYIIKAVDGDRENAECAVFYFGSGLGGDKESNLQRWENQFEQADGRNSADLAVIKEMDVSGIKATMIELNGIYKLATGPMMEVKEKKLGYRLLGAIVEGPQGSVFFKMVGPEKTVTAAHDDFMKMIFSVRAQGA